MNQQNEPAGSMPSFVRCKVGLLLATLMLLAWSAPSSAQQKGQWQPGQFGLNAGSIPSPGITYANMPLSYSASQLNNSNGNPVQGVTGTYSIWVDENIVYYVPQHRSSAAISCPTLT